MVVERRILIRAARRKVVGWRSQLGGFGQANRHKCKQLQTSSSKDKFKKGICHDYLAINGGTIVHNVANVVSPLKGQYPESPHYL
jgi:hypothetical protein